MKTTLDNQKLRDKAVKFLSDNTESKMNFPDLMVRFVQEFLKENTVMHTSQMRTPVYTRNRVDEEYLNTQINKSHLMGILERGELPKIIVKEIHDEEDFSVITTSMVCVKIGDIIEIE